MSKWLFEQIEMTAKNPKELGLRGHLTFRGNDSIGRHGWLRLTPAYSLHLVRELLESSGPNELVLEPFCGTGTTPLVCAAQEIQCHAIDINPFLVWLTTLKLTRFNKEIVDDVKLSASEIAKQVRNPGIRPWKPSIHAIEKWWDAKTLRTLALLFEGIRCSEDKRADGVSDLLRIAFCRAMIQTANVSFGHQSMSFKKKKSDNGGALFRESTADSTRNVAGRFVLAAREVADSLVVEPPIAECSVFLGDSRDVSTVVPNRGYTTVITSPPYPNRMSYIRELRPYMYWLGFLNDGRTAGEMDWKAIGGTWGCATSLLNTWSPDDFGAIPFVHFDRIVHDIGKKHVLLGRYVHKYFADIKEHILGLRKVLAPGARCHYIVGNSKFYDTLLPVEEIYAALFEDAGLVNVRIEVIRKRTSKKELYEFIVHAEAPQQSQAASAI